MTEIGPLLESLCKMQIEPLQLAKKDGLMSLNNRPANPELVSSLLG
jgi:hypothetical protein